VEAAVCPFCEGVSTPRLGQVASRPIDAAIGVTLAGEKDILMLWARHLARFLIQEEPLRPWWLR
jgi:hypothetical protein